MSCRSIGFCTAVLCVFLVSLPGFAGLEALDFVSLDTDGGDPVIIETETHIVTASAIDVENRLIYLSDQGSDLSVPGGRILRMNLDGSGRQDLIANQWPVFGMALDLVDGHIYYIESNVNLVRRANLDGSNIVDVVALPQLSTSLALDRPGGKLYITSLYKIWRANLDGSDFEIIVDNDDFNAAVAVDLSASRLYFGGNEGLSRANLDGTNVEKIIDDAHVFTIALDLADATIYWASPIDQRLERSALDGSDRQLLRMLTSPAALALDTVEARLYLRVDELDPVDVPASSSGALVFLITGMLAASLSLFRRRKSGAMPES